MYGFITTRMLWRASTKKNSSFRVRDLKGLGFRVLDLALTFQSFGCRVQDLGSIV